MESAIIQEQSAGEQHVFTDLEHWECPGRLKNFYPLNREYAKQYRRRVIADCKSPSAWSILETLQLYADYGTGENIFPSEQTIADECKCTTRTVSSVIHALEAHGWISITKRYNNSNLYTILRPMHLAPESVSAPRPESVSDLDQKAFPVGPESVSTYQDSFTETQNTKQTDMAKDLAIAPADPCQAACLSDGSLGDAVAANDVGVIAPDQNIVVRDDRATDAAFIAYVLKAADVQLTATDLRRLGGGGLELIHTRNRVYMSFLQDRIDHFSRAARKDPSKGKDYLLNILAKSSGDHSWPEYRDTCERQIAREEREAAEEARRIKEWQDYQDRCAANPDLRIRTYDI